LVLIQQLGATYSRFRSQARQEHRLLREAQSIALGFDHVELSTRLLAQWGMPPSFVAIIAGKETENDSPIEQALLKVVKVAEQMACVVEEGSDHVLLSAAAKTDLGLTKAQVEEILAGLMQCTEELAQILSLDLPPRAELSVAAHARLAEATAQMLEGATEHTLLAETMELRSHLQAVIHRPIGAPASTAQKQP